MVETTNACRKNWVHEHGIAYNNLYKFKEQFEVVINELNNQKNSNEKLSIIHEQESDKLIELKTNITNYNDLYHSKILYNNKELAEYQKKIHELQDRYKNGKTNHDYLTRK